MKTIITITTCITLIFGAFTSFAQVTVSTENMTYSNGDSISNCGTIDLGTNQDTSISFWINLSKNSNQVVGDGDLYVYTKYNVNDASENQVYWKTIPSSYWTNSDTQYSEYTTPVITLQSQMFNTSGGVLFVRYVSSSNVKYNSCNYSIIKDETPTFTISPSSTNVTCDSASPKTFTVTNVYNSPGTLTYNWQVGNGWEYEGNTVSNFTTSTNSVALVPTSFPPSNVKVTPVLDGKSYSQLTSTVSLKDYNPSYSISGNSSICLSSTPEVYSIANLPSDVTVTWSSSNTAIATVNSTTGSSTTVNLLSNGTFNLNARVTNSCGQYLDIPPKRISVGNPEITRLMHISTFGCTMGEINVAVSGNAQLFEWQVSGGEIVIPNSGTTYIGGGTIFVDPSDTNFGFTVKVRAINSCGHSSWYSEYIPTSCDPDDGGGVTPLFSDIETKINNKEIKAYPNPVKNELIILSGKNILSEIQLYSLKGILVLEKPNPLNIEVLDLSKMPNGIYSMWLLGETKTVKKIIVQH